LYGFYDNDSHTDIVAFDPASGIFEIRYSSSSWNTEYWYRLRYDSAGRAIAFRGLETCAYGFCRQGIGVWTVSSSSAPVVQVLWDPFAARKTSIWEFSRDPGTKTSCFKGANDWVPLGGQLDYDSDGRSDLVFGRPDLFGGWGGLTIYAANSTDCSSATAHSLLAPVEFKEGRPFLFDSMFSDANPDVGFVDMTTMDWVLFRSESSFQRWPSTGTVQLGTADAQLL